MPNNWPYPKPRTLQGSPARGENCFIRKKCNRSYIERGKTVFQPGWSGLGMQGFWVSPVLCVKTMDNLRTDGGIVCVRSSTDRTHSAQTVTVSCGYIDFLQAVLHAITPPLSTFFFFNFNLLERGLYPLSTMPITRATN